jgi:predicted ATPase
MKLSPNELAAETERVRQNNYQQFVKKVRLRNVRGFQDEVIEFRTPVTALIGTNGGGKSTILGSVALAYKNMRPSQFFPKAFIGDESMADWSIEFELVEKSISSVKTIAKTAKFTQSKWRRDDFTERPIQYVEIQRTVPAGEQGRFRKFLAGDLDDYVVEKLVDDTIKYGTAVLDKDISHYRIVKSKYNQNYKMYIGSTYSKTDYSQFHFGAGEASVIETIDRIETAPNNSLVLIEELENGLHPVAVRLLVQYLQNAAKRKRLQVAFTTHSQEAINDLPPESIWASINKRTWNGDLSIESLRSITGSVPNTRAIYVEDEFVKSWVENAIGRYGEGMAETTKVFTAGGYPNVVKVSQYHNENPMISVPSVALVDGDIFNPSSEKPLPDHARYIGDGTPEEIVFSYIFENRQELISIIRQRCFLSQFPEDRIKIAIESVRNSSCDPHLIYSELSQKLDFVSALYIRAGMIDLFNEKNPEFWMSNIAFVRDQMNRQP